jgi:hypothetical protein
MALLIDQDAAHTIVIGQYDRSLAASISKMVWQDAFTQEQSCMNFSAHPF